MRRSPPWPRAAPTSVVAGALLVSVVLCPGFRGASGETTPARQLSSPEELLVQPPTHCLSPEEMDLARRINVHRAAHGLPAVPLSRSLTEVAKSHVFDLERSGANWATDERGVPCSLHSWSDDGPWSSVCYTRDHRYAGEMWNKPQQVTGDLYPWPGVEIAHWSLKPVSSLSSVAAWKDSPSHDAVILEQQKWKDAQWPAMGVALMRNYAVVWFGSKPDPEGSVGQCEESRDQFLRSIRETVRIRQDPAIAGSQERSSGVP